MGLAMIRMFTFVTLIGLSVLPAAGSARPYPAGRCTTLDDGVEPLARTAKSTLLDLEAVSMDLPSERPATVGRLDNAFVADVSLIVRPDGSVASPKILCTNPVDPAYARALIRMAPQWKFRVPVEAGGRSLRAAYRIVVATQPSRTETISLGWTPLS